MSDNTSTQGQADELNGLSKLLFDRSVFLWYIALCIEVVAGIVAATSGLARLTDDWNLVLAIAGFLLLCFSYYLKIRFSLIYDNAETMRRQAVLNNALDWSITKTQFSEWRRLAGEKIIKKFETVVKDPNYFETKTEKGPKRLLEMTQESAFWTRHLYCYLRGHVWCAFIFALVFVIGLLTITSSNIVSSGIASKIVYAIYLLLPLILTIDILGWGIKLNQLITSIKQIEADLEELSQDSQLNVQKVLRLVSEYNCQVVGGFPIPSWFFRKYHDFISQLWKKRT